MSHAEYTRLCLEAADRAVADFEAGITENPYPENSIGHSPWAFKMLKLVHTRDCDQTVCCSEHHVHLNTSGGVRFGGGGSSCHICRTGS